MHSKLLPEEILRKVKRIEITARKLMDESVTGEYRSQFKGHGMQFSEHRQYMAGDDVRHIDWKVSARSREPVIKKYEEERELNILLVVDVSASAEFGSERKLKGEVMAELGGLLAYAASSTGDKIGALLFAGGVEKVIPPRRGIGHVSRVIRELLAYEPRTRGTDLTAALDAASRIMKHAGVVFVLSDFLAHGYEQALSRLSMRHDVIAVWVGDPREREMPDSEWLWLEDPETGKTAPVDTGSYAFRKWLSEVRQETETGTLAAFKSRGIESIRVTTREDYGEALVRFLKARGRSRSRRGTASTKGAAQ